MHLTFLLFIVSIRQVKDFLVKLGMEVHACKPSKWEAKASKCHAFEASQGRTVPCQEGI